jgi:hypothetical protein
MQRFVDETDNVIRLFAISGDDKRARLGERKAPYFITESGAVAAAAATTRNNKRLMSGSWRSSLAERTWRVDPSLPTST